MPEEVLVSKIANAFVEVARPHLSMPMVSLIRRVSGGLWVGGRVTLTTEAVSFSPNGLNRIAQSGTLDIRVPLSDVIEVEVRPGVFTNIVAITTPESVVRVRCYSRPGSRGRSWLLATGSGSHAATFRRGSGSTDPGRRSGDVLLRRRSPPTKRYVTLET